jgi:UDP-N-acetylglucosamine diphosphorylase / glucose-1-phosphate thymidylyltransferase / UDP-N-acetylgalactosamine diphosphorylase / glucosamine-1-phosphate N-acetyltransferase / galactosamine-1-phosphate N-acetyltransferase
MRSGEEREMRLFDGQITGFQASALGEFSGHMPWDLTSNATRIVAQLLGRLGDDFALSDNIAIHRTATIEGGAILKGPAIIGPECFIAAGAYVRDGCWLEANCILGPGAELKSSFVFGGSKLAHFNFVGDSILGHEVNLEAGSIIANFRNEGADPAISFIHMGKRIETGARKFGALAGDRTKIGANAVVAPGAILAPGTIVKRLSLVDQAVAADVA